MSLRWILLWFKPLRTHLLRTMEEVRKIEMHNLPARNKTIRDLTLAIANMADIDMIRKNSKVRKATTSQGTINWLFRAATPDIKNVWIRGLSSRVSIGRTENLLASDDNIEFLKHFTLWIPYWKIKVHRINMHHFEALTW